ADERFAIGALKRCQLTCETIDVENGIKEPELSWFWPERESNLSEEANEAPEDIAIADDISDEEEFTPTEKLEMLTSYLRTSYKFCFWCGVHYKDQEDMSTNCPGEGRDDH
ncbi:G patch domain-containing protein 11-like, partial [Rhagoletis pomonella]|uniref:G patch domain-containing protein 11-like n=1 Tax=Rhagoletis pomonella TaxID=28610 RepID=UPI0017849CA0